MLVLCTCLAIVASVAGLAITLVLFVAFAVRASQFARRRALFAFNIWFIAVAADAHLADSFFFLKKMLTNYFTSVNKNI